MNFKLVHIKYRFLIQGILFIVFLAILTGIIQTISNRMKELQNTRNRINDLEKEIVRLQNTYLNFLYHTTAENQFFRDGENNNTLLFSQQISSAKATLYHLSKYNNINRKLLSSGFPDSLSSALDNYSLVFDRTKLSLKELGILSSGKIKILRESSEKLVTALQSLNINDLYPLITRLKEFESEYLFSASQSAFENINILLDGLSYNPSLSEALLSPDSDISILISDYKDNFAQVNSIITRLGTVDNVNSLLGEMDRNYLELTTIHSHFETWWQIFKKQRLSLINLVGGLFILIFLLLYLAYLYRFYRQFQKPLDESIEFSYNIAKGKNNTSLLNTEYYDEFSRLNHNLNNINDSLNGKKNFVDDLLKQKFQTDLSLQGKNDTFGKTLIALKENMRKARDEQSKYHEENRVRRYQNEGLAKFSDILRNNSDNLEKMSDVFIKEIVRYLEAIQGGLFLLENEDDEELHLKAAFAYNRKKYLTKTIRKGESLVGTCALEKKTINLADIPEDYIEITSGLGDAPPTNLLIIPVMHEGVLIGVLEIASLHKFNENQITLGETISESLASSIINARINSRTSELLQKSQQQAAEMAEQEEEMRQNMEELKATQEESARREEDLEGLLNAISQAFYVIEYDIEGTITKVNERFLYLANLHADKVLGKKHSHLFGKRSKADALLFANVAAGNTVELIEKVEINKKLFEIKNTFSPVKSKEGNTLRILNIMALLT
jgi:PAS domain-containing protein